MIKKTDTTYQQAIAVNIQTLRHDLALLQVDVDRKDGQNRADLVELERGLAMLEVIYEPPGDIGA